MNLLGRIEKAGDIKNIEAENIGLLCEEIRDMLINVITMNGGHLASNLGVVELTVALHRCLDLEKDFIVFDVGHQSYVHKILTGRKDCLKSIGKKDGIAAFPDCEESRYDSFNTGHASTSVSAALGMEKAYRLTGNQIQAVCVIGDGALAGGMVYEALNNASDLDSNILIVLNDNEMSINKNVGAISKYLSKLRVKSSYIETNKKVKSIVEKLPGGGKKLISRIHRIKSAMKSFTGQKMLFEDMGIRYIGPVDGHDEQQLEDVINKVLKVKGPKLLHVTTVKGKGYEKAEKDPVKYHGIASGQSRKSKSESSMSYSTVFGNTLYDLASKDKSIVCVCPAMTQGSGLSEFAADFADRYFDVGICEQHAVTFSAGLCTNDIKPVCVIYSSFLQRSYDQLVHDVGLFNKKVVVCVDRAGVNEAYGKTHQGIFDIAFLSTVPNMEIYTPESINDIHDLLNYALYENAGCIAIRYPADFIRNDQNRNMSVDYGQNAPVVFNKDSKKAFLCYGRMLSVAIDASNQVGAVVVKLRKVHPVDFDVLYSILERYEKVVCAEDVIYNGSVGQRFRAWMHQHEKTTFDFVTVTVDEDSSFSGNVHDILKENNLTSEQLSYIMQNEQT